MNNLKLIREIYGATQEDIASALSISRVTISNWEKDQTNKITPSNLEKLSIFFGIGPECFHEIEIDDVRRQMIMNSSNRAKEIDATNKSNKNESFHNLFDNTTFTQAMKKYMFSMKMLLALADNGNLEDLKIIYQINQKMGERLKSIVEIREQEEKEKVLNNGATLKDLMDELSTNMEEN